VRDAADDHAPLGRAARVGRVAALVLLAALFAVPLAILVATSLKSDAELLQGAHLFAWPASPGFGAWRDAWARACIGTRCEGLRPYFLNSVAIVVPSVLVSTALGAINGYALGLWRFRGDRALFGLLLAGCFLPYQIVILPMARALGLLGLASCRAGLILVHCVYGLAFTTLFCRNFLVAVPRALVQAAEIDGAGFWAIFGRIVLPLMRGVLVVCVIWQFTNVWNDFLFGAVFAPPDAAPVTVALNNLVNTSTGAKRYNVDMAAALLAGLPTLLVYLVAGRYFVRGMLAGAVKG
jgi:glucose/mannose transport system permease protein